MTAADRRAALEAFQREHGAYGHESWQIKNRIAELEREAAHAQTDEPAAGNAQAADRADASTAHDVPAAGDPRPG
jgi:hypothetical protein